MTVATAGERGEPSLDERIYECERMIDRLPSLAEHKRVLDLRDDLAKALADTLNMLQAAHMQLGIDHKGNKRVIAARAALAKARGTP